MLAITGLKASKFVTPHLLGQTSWLYGKGGITSREDCLHMIFAQASKQSPPRILIFSRVLGFKQPKKKKMVQEHNHITGSSNSILGEWCDDIYKSQQLFAKVANDHTTVYTLSQIHRPMWHLLNCDHLPSWSPVCGYSPLKGLEHMWTHMHPLSRLPFFWFPYSRDASRATQHVQKSKQLMKDTVI